MLDWTEEGIMLSHTRQDIYVVEAVSLEDHTVEKLRYPFRESASGVPQSGKQGGLVPAVFTLSIITDD